MRRHEGHGREGGERHVAARRPDRLGAEVALAARIGNRAYGRLLRARAAGTVLARQSAEESSETGPCRVDVRATSTPIGFSHLFLVYTNENGNEYGYRAGPSLPGGFGDIEGDYGSYGPETFPDYDVTAPSVTALTGSAACGKGDELSTELRAITDAHIPYRYFGPNSNTVVSHLLATCDLPRVTPIEDPIGWDADLFERNGGGGGEEGSGPGSEGGGGEGGAPGG